MRSVLLIGGAPRLRARDYIDVRDGGADSVSCGPGKDVVLYDASDTIASDCEIALLS